VAAPPLERVTIVTPEERLAGILAHAGSDVVVGGHTHRQFDRVAGGRRMVNAGSVGRPYEWEPGAYWARLGPDVRLIRTPYDVEAASSKPLPAASLIADHRALRR
jgi:diadenosine tetraphosphatase ApaH/serine/threonine PP2A family protein phosphatase